ncbi:MAG: hypothetical protein IJ412_07840 [Oscillospiraceae bacterium]|nr:hypothetical protein [Oscillospiraceae bacterium]
MKAEKGFPREFSVFLVKNGKTGCDMPCPKCKKQDEKPRKARGYGLFWFVVGMHKK